MSQPAAPGVWQTFGLAVMMAMVEARGDAVAEQIVEVSAEELWLAEGRCARFGFPLACGRLPVAVGGFVCLCSMSEARRYHDEFLALPGAA